MLQSLKSNLDLVMSEALLVNISMEAFVVKIKRDGNAKTPYTRIQNLDRVRVVVK
jgi:hypothetical protein